MGTDTKNHAVDKLAIAAYICGDINEEEKSRLEKHLDGCPECKAYYEQVRAEKATFLAKYPFESLQIPTPEDSKKIIVFPVMYRYLALAATLVLIVGGPLIYNSLKQGSYNGIKGGAGIKIAVQNLAGGIEERDNNQYYPGEGVQFLYSCSDKNYLILLGIDENGKVSTYFPAAQDSSIFLQKGAGIPLPQSIRLDDYIGKELFIAFFSDKKLYVPEIRNHILSAFREAGSLDALSVKKSNAFDIYTIPITKIKPIQ